MDGRERAEPEVDGVPEGEESRLPEQHVEREREHGGNADLAEQRDPRALLRQQRRDDDDDEVGREPGDATAREARLHVSRAPMIPRGRKMRISTMTMYGMIGANCVSERRV